MVCNFLLLTGHLCFPYVEHMTQGKQIGKQMAVKMPGCIASACHGQVPEVTRLLSR